MTARFPILFSLLLLSGCGEAGEVRSVPGGIARLAPPLIAHHGCGTCHRIPGIAGANGASAPPLIAMSKQAYVAGVVANTPENLVRFIQNPQAIDPRSAMPNLGLAEEDARHIAAWLYAEEDG